MRFCTAGTIILRGLLQIANGYDAAAKNDDDILHPDCVFR
jgi:hypothetical protein